MLHQRELSGDKLLFQLLKNRSPTASNICEKLNHNVKNIILLSEDELCELWQHMKVILLEAQKLDELTSNNRDKYVKEYSHMIKLIRTITAIALETIVQRIFIPNVLLENIILLHSVVLPTIKDEQAKNEISYLLENWWKLDMTWKEKVIINALKYLIQNCNSSLENIKRLYQIRSTITLLKCTEDVQELLKLVREKTVMSLEEGRMLILHLFTLGEQYILGIHNNVRVVLQNIEHTYIAAYADLYVTAWLNATKKLKKFIVQNCLQNIVFHCFRAYRDSGGRGKLGQNLFSFLAAIHDNKHQTAKLMIHNQCKPLLWKHLEAPGSFIRCNAVEILFMTSSVQYTCVSKDRNKIYIQKFHQTVTNLLKDSDSKVCIITMNGLFKMLEKHWTCFPNNIIRNWLNILLHYTKNASNYKIRANVFIGLKNVLVKGRSQKILKDFLPNFANSIYDDNKTVLEELIKLLWHAQNELGMPFWNIVPLSYILDRLETTQDMFLLRELIKLVWLRVSSNGAQYDKIKDEIVYIGINNINAIRRFSFHSKPVIKWNMSTKLIQTMLPIIKEEMECLPLTQALKTNNKKAKHNHQGKKQKNDRINNCDEDIDSYRDVQIYIDVIAMLLIANVKNIEEEKFCKGEIKILQEIAHSLPEFFKYFKETSINESVIFLFSLIPSRFFLNQIEVIETLVQQLCNPNSSDDTLLTIIYVLIKWNKGDTILFALTNLFTESLNLNTQNNQGVTNNTDTFQINGKGLELSLRILKHLLHVEHRSKDVFDASEHFSDILLWVKKVMVPHISCIDMNNIENHQTCIDLIKNTFDISNLLLKEYNSTPKLCCDIVLLYCSCLSPVSGIIFLNKAFDAIIILLDFSQMAYEKQEPNLLNIVVPNFICMTNIDMLSALVVICKILKTSDRTVINRLKNMTLASKVYNQKQSCDTPLERYY
ncbi:Condensin-2 complex subunit G2 [Habropoda laboriosa]|uniref:Condensin-2 complex subunit G2 n=1 Tax=Habropoda laboriosa TaxID=597456 RepID=A0A0L7RHR0_9HYME|nr:Condensin-2 complex subunit G2 [Habropoda laboriosa]